MTAHRGFNLILALDSSSRKLTFALGGGHHKMLHVDTEKDFRHAETIVLQIEHLMKRSGLSLSDVDCLACGVGPGSFTGLRVGLAAVKAILMSRNLACYTVSTLDLIAQNAWRLLGEKISSVRVLVDARRSRYYTAEYSRQGRDLLKRSGDEILSLAEIVSKLKKQTALLGDGIPSIQSSELSQKFEDVEFMPDSTWYPRATEIIRLVEENSVLLKRVDIRGIEPAYLRPTEPEERLLALEKKKNG